jgi:hypothetical protein
MARPDMKAALAVAAGQKTAVNDADTIAPSRIGRRQIAGFFSPETAKQLRRLACERDTTIQSLLAESLNDLFSKHGKPPLA